MTVKNILVYHNIRQYIRTYNKSHYETTYKDVLKCRTLQSLAIFNIKVKYITFISYASMFKYALVYAYFFSQEIIWNKKFKKDLFNISTISPRYKD